MPDIIFIPSVWYIAQLFNELNKIDFKKCLPSFKTLAYNFFFFIISKCQMGYSLFFRWILIGL